MIHQTLVKTAALAVGACLCMALPARAGDSMGATSTPRPSLLSANTVIEPLYYGPQAAWSVAANGCGLRNRGDCAVDISNAFGPAYDAIVVWTIILPAGMSPTDPRVSTIGIVHGEFGVSLAGTVLGTGPDPCWLTSTTSTPIVTYYSFIPLSIINNESNPTPGNGDYHIFLEPGGSGVTTGANPWSIATPPLAEGATIMILGTGSKKIAIWGGPGFTGLTFAGGQQSYTLGFSPLPNPVNGSEADFVSMYADGQTTVTGYIDSASLAIKEMVINGVNVAGSGSAINPTSNLDGQTAHPLPQLWDVSEFDIGTQGVFASNNSTMAITVGSPSQDDCITPIFHVLTY